MDEFNRELNPLDEYAPVDQKFNTQPPQPQYEPTAPQTVTVDTADEEDNSPAMEAPKAENNVNPQIPQESAYENTFAQNVQPQPLNNQYEPDWYRNSQQSNVPNHNNYAHPNYQQNIPPQMFQGYQQPPVQQPIVNQYNNYPYGNPQPMYKEEPVRSNEVDYNSNPYVQKAPAQNPYYNPQNPYAVYQQPKEQKPKTPTGTKVLIGILIGLLLIFMVAFFSSCSKYLFYDKSNDDESNNPLSGYATEPPTEFIFGFDDSISPYFNNAPSFEGDSFDEKITLMADEGETQEKSKDEKANTSKPDEKASGVDFDDIPKDKEDKKYTTQSAYNTVTDSVVSIICYQDKITDNEADIIGEGTGTVISSDGYIVTNSHVIGDTNTYKIKVVLNNSEEYEAKIAGYDTRTDLAVVKIDAKNLSYAKFSDSSLVEVGQDVVAIGNPGGSSFQNSLTKGIVSAVERELDLGANVNYIQIDAAINPGNSGGPLCNLYGQVIGINTAKISADAYEGMGFAIPSNKVAQIANDLIHYGYVKDRVRIGIMGREVDEEMKYNYDVPNGVLITEIAEDGPLYNTDIKEFDIITAIDGKEVSTFQEIFAILEEHKPGDKVTLTLYRLEE